MCIRFGMFAILLAFDDRNMNFVLDSFSLSLFAISQVESLSSAEAAIFKASSTLLL